MEGRLGNRCFKRYVSRSVWSYVKHVLQKRKRIRYAASKDKEVCECLVIREAHATRRKWVRHVLSYLVLPRNIFVAQTQSLDIRKSWLWSSQIATTDFSFIHLFLFVLYFDATPMSSNLCLPVSTTGPLFYLWPPPAWLLSPPSCLPPNLRLSFRILMTGPLFSTNPQLCPAPPLFLTLRYW